VKFIVTYPPFRLLPGAGTKSKFRLQYPLSVLIAISNFLRPFYRLGITSDVGVRDCYLDAYPGPGSQPGCV
jgi:hypothetical protein